ncbi:MAG: phosphomannomutase/phosphoglucomutase, partial [Pseudomonadales bacterium]
VEAGIAIHPEAIRTDEGWVLGLAAPIKTPSDEEIKGTLFVYLEMSALSDGLSELLDGEVRLIQTFGGTSNDILTLGGNGVAGSEIRRRLNNVNWSLIYYPSPTVINAPISSPIEFLMPLIVFLVVAIAGTLAGVSSLLKRTNADAARLANQITEVIKGEYSHSTDYDLHAFVDLDANLHRMGRKNEIKPEVEKLNVTLQPKQKPREEMVDIEEIDEEDYEREMQQKVAREEPSKPDAKSAPTQDDPALAEIFRAYDIRGIVDQTLTPAVIKKIGLAIGTEAGEIGEQTLIVGADGRVSSPSVVEALIEGLTESGRDIINIGSVPTPIVYYATQNSEARSGVMVTASHNPANYNGFKIVLDGRTLVEEDIQRIYARVVAENFSSGSGNVSEADITQDYIEAITDDVVVAQPLKIVIDCANGIAGAVAPDLFAGLGCDVTPLYCDVDGTFPNHPPDPTVAENLSDLVLMVKSEGADLGIAFDGDGDRLVAVTKKGEIVWPDRLLMLFARDVVSRNPGSDVVYDVKCTRHLNSVISSFGGRPIISRSGHSFIKAKMLETGAALGGEMSGHICFGERWYGFDD